MPSWRSRTKTLCTSTLRGQTYELRWTEILRAPTAGRFTRSPVMSSPSHSSAHWTAVGRSTARSFSTSSALVIISPVGSGGPTSPSEPLAVYIVDTIISTSEAKILRSMDQGLSWQSAASFDNFGVFVSIATDNQTGAVYVAGVDPSGTVLVTRSLDQGQTWNPPVNVSNGLTPAIPQVAALRDDVVAAFLSGNDSTAEVSVAVSHDGGLTWPTVNTVSPKTLCSAATPSVTVSHDGIFAVSWVTSLTGTGCLWQGQKPTLATFVSVSRDHGNTFPAPIEVSRYPGAANIAFAAALRFHNRNP